jgi:hypothetical protein
MPRERLLWLLPPSLDSQHSPMVMRRPLDPTQRLGLGLRELSDLAEVVGGPGTRVKDTALFQRTLADADSRLQGEQAAETRAAETGAAMTAANAQSMPAPDVQYEHGVPFGTSTISVPRIDPKYAGLSREEQMIEVQRLVASGVPERVATIMVIPPHQEEGGRPTIFSQEGALERAVHGTDPIELERTRQRVATTYKVLGAGALVAATAPLSIGGGTAATLGFGALRYGGTRLLPKAASAIARHSPSIAQGFIRGEIGRRAAQEVGLPWQAQIAADVVWGGGTPFAKGLIRAPGAVGRITKSLVTRGPKDAIAFNPDTAIPELRHAFDEGRLQDVGDGFYLLKETAEELSEATLIRTTAAAADVPVSTAARAGVQNIEIAQTGRPFTGKLFRGSGRETVEEVYDPHFVQGPIFGEAVYTSPSKKFAGEFGSQIDEIEISLRNPLVISSDTEWRALAQESGLLSHVPIRPEEVTRLRQVIQAKGHDGVIVRVPESEDVGKRLQQAFGEDTVVSFNPAITAPDASAVAAAAEGGVQEAALGAVRRLQLWTKDQNPLLGIVGKLLDPGTGKVGGVAEVELRPLFKDASGKLVAGGLDDVGLQGTFSRRELLKIAKSTMDELGVDELVGVRLGRGTQEATQSITRKQVMDGLSRTVEATSWPEVRVGVNAVNASREAVEAKNLEDRAVLQPVLNLIMNQMKNVPAKIKEVKQARAASRRRGVAKGIGIKESLEQKMVIPEALVDKIPVSALKGTGGGAGEAWGPLGREVVEEAEEVLVDKATGAVLEAIPRGTGTLGPVTKLTGPARKRVITAAEKKWGVEVKLVTPDMVEATRGQYLRQLVPLESATEQGITGVQFNALFKLVGDRFPDLFSVATGKMVPRFLTRERAKTGLYKVLSGVTPTEGELSLLEKALGPDFVKAARAHVSWIKRAGEIAFDIAGLLPKAIRSSGDFSGLLRQAGVITVNPFHAKTTASAFAVMVRVGLGPNPRKIAIQRFEDMRDIRKNPYAERLLGVNPELVDPTGEIAKAVRVRAEKAKGLTQEGAEEAVAKAGGENKIELHNPHKGLQTSTEREEEFASVIAEWLPDAGFDVKHLFGERGLTVPTVARLGLRVATQPVRLVGKVVERSQLSFGALLNELRMGVASKTLANWDAAANERILTPMGWRPGRGAVTQAEVDSLINSTNVLTGRGATPFPKQAGRGMDWSLAGFMNRAAQATFWAPRFAISRIQAPIIGLTRSGTDVTVDALRWMVGKEATGNRARKQLARDLVTFVFDTTAVIAAFKVFGLVDEVELDCRSSDFGKMKRGRSTFDFWAGYQPIVRYVCQMMPSMSGQDPRVTRIFGTDWEVPKLASRARTLRKGELIDRPIGPTMLRFLRSKTAPGAPTAILNRVNGETFLGTDIHEKKIFYPTGIEMTVEQAELIEQWIPLFTMDIAEAVEAQGGSGPNFNIDPVEMGLHALSFFGTGSQVMELSAQEKLKQEYMGKFGMPEGQAEYLSKYDARGME